MNLIHSGINAKRKDGVGMSVSDIFEKDFNAGAVLVGAFGA